MPVPRGGWRTSDEREGPSLPGGRIARFVREWALVGQGILLLAAIGGRWWWPLDLPNHFVPHGAALAALGLAAAVVGRAPRSGATLAAALIWSGTRLLPEWAHEAPTDGVPLRLMVANVHSSNTDHQAMLDLVAAEDPDVVGFLEVNDRWLDALSVLRAGRPFAVARPREDNFGLAVYSRVPLVGLEVRSLATAPVPSVLAWIHGARVVLTHPLPPIGVAYAARRDEQLDAIADLRRDERVIVAGDLNATPWSAAFPGRRPGARPGSWPAPFPLALRIPIDHVLVGRRVRLERLRVGPDVGSDHRPVIADLIVPPAAAH